MAHHSFTLPRLLTFSKGTTRSPKWISSSRIKMQAEEKCHSISPIKMISPLVTLVVRWEAAAGVSSSKSGFLWIKRSENTLKLYMSKQRYIALGRRSSAFIRSQKWYLVTPEWLRISALNSLISQFLPCLYFWTLRYAKHLSSDCLHHRNLRTLSDWARGWQAGYE